MTTPPPRRPALDAGFGFLACILTMRSMEKGGWLYIVANRYRGGPYIGVTSDLIRRVHQHRTGSGSRHVSDFNKIRLVYVERHDEIEHAIVREKLVKKWKRDWKFALIEADNPKWRDLWDQWFASAGDKE